MTKRTLFSFQGKKCTHIKSQHNRIQPTREILNNELEKRIEENNICIKQIQKYQEINAAAKEEN